MYSCGNMKHACLLAAKLMKSYSYCKEHATWNRSSFVSDVLQMPHHETNMLLTWNFAIPWKINKKKWLKAKQDKINTVYDHKSMHNKVTTLSTKSGTTLPLRIECHKTSTQKNEDHLYFFKQTMYLIRWAGHVACMEEGRGVHKVLVGKPEGKRPLGRPRRR